MKKLLLLSLAIILLACWVITVAGTEPSASNSGEPRFVYRANEEPEPEAETSIPSELLGSKVYLDRGQDIWLKIAKEYGTEDHVTRLSEFMDDGVISDDELEQYRTLTEEIGNYMRATHCQKDEPPLILEIISETEPNNSPGEANPMACGDRVECAHFDVADAPPVDKYDWFTFELDSTYEYWNVTCSTYAAPDCSDPDSSMETSWISLYDAAMQLMAQSQPYGEHAAIFKNGLVPGTYFLEVSAFEYIPPFVGYYNLDLYCEEGGPPPLGDVCADPIVIESLPFTETRNSCDYTDDYLYPGNDVIYELTISEPTVISVSLCNTADPDFESFIGIQTENTEPIICGTYNFYAMAQLEGCEAGNSNAEHPYIELTPAGTYTIMIDAMSMMGPGCTDYTIEVEKVLPCFVECPSENAYIEQEICGNDENGGCNMQWDPTFEYIDCGDTVCGTFWLDPNTFMRDTDWYEFTVTEDRALVTISGMAEYYYQLMILRPGYPDPCGYNQAYMGYVSGYPCTETTLEVYLYAGTYWAWAGPSAPYLNPVPPAVCGENDSYYFTLTCEPVPSGGPVNDWCEDVTPVPLNEGDYLTFTGNVEGATRDCYLNDPYTDVWHAFTTTERLDITIDYCTTTPPFGVQVPAILPDCPCSGFDYHRVWDWDFMACGDGNATMRVLNVAPGTWYYPIASDESWGVSDYTLHVSGAACPPPPPNDNCENAIPIADDETVEYNTLYASLDGPVMCQSYPNLWYVYTATNTGYARVIMNGGQLHSEAVGVYDGSECPPTTMLACAEQDWMYWPPHAEAVFSVIEGNQYLIEAGGAYALQQWSVGVGELVVRFEPTHDVGVIRIKEPEHILLDGVSDYSVVASILNYGMDQETFDVVASDDHGFSSTYGNLTLNPGQEITIFFPDLYPSPDDTCEVHNLTITTQLTGDERPQNDAMSTSYSYSRIPETMYSYDDGDETTTQGLYPQGDWIYALEYIAEAREDIVRIGYLSHIERTPFYREPDETIDPVKLYLFLDLGEDGIPDEPAVFETYVSLPENAPFWTYAVLPCAVTVEAGQSFWVGWQGPDDVTGGEYLWCDNSLNWGSKGWCKETGVWENPSSHFYWGDPFLRAWTVPVGYEYIPGDANMYNGQWPPQVIGGDVTYLVNYFRGMETSLPCPLDGFWCSADANGDCNVIGSDVTKLVTYFRGLTSLQYCPDYEPAWPPVPDDAPEGWPNCDVPE